MLLLYTCVGCASMDSSINMHSLCMSIRAAGGFAMTTFTMWSWSLAKQATREERA